MKAKKEPATCAGLNWPEPEGEDAACYSAPLSYNPKARFARSIANGV